MKTTGIKGLVIGTTIINVIVIAVLGLAVYCVKSTGILSVLGLCQGDTSSLSILLDRATEGTIISSYSDESEGRVVTTVEIESAMSQIGELATVSYDYSGVTLSSDSRQIVDWDVPLTRNMVAVEYEGMIRAGYTVSDIEFSVNNETRTITVSLPEIEVFSNEITSENVEWEDNILNHIDPDTVTNLMEEAREEELEAAFESGMLLEAESNAQVIVTDVLSKLCDYNIEFVSNRTALEGKC